MSDADYRDPHTALLERQTALLEENDRLRTEIDRLRTELAQAKLPAMAPPPVQAAPPPFTPGTTRQLRVVGFGVLGFMVVVAVIVGGMAFFLTFSPPKSAIPVPPPALKKVFVSWEGKVKSTSDGAEVSAGTPCTISTSLHLDARADKSLTEKSFAQGMLVKCGDVDVYSEPKGRFNNLYGQSGSRRNWLSHRLDRWPLQFRRRRSGSHQRKVLACPHRHGEGRRALLKRDPAGDDRDHDHAREPNDARRGALK